MAFNFTHIPAPIVHAGCLSSPNKGMLMFICQPWRCSDRPNEVRGDTWIRRAHFCPLKVKTGPESFEE